MHQQLAGHPSGLRLRSRLAMNKTQTSDLIPPTVPENKGERQCGRGILSIPFTAYRLLSGSAALWVFVVAVTLLPLAAATAQGGPPGYRSDNSDWWSYTRRPDADDGISQKRELPDSNFQILGLKLNDEIFGKASAKLGKATIVQRGDASTGRSQICYSSPGKRGKIYVIFEKGEVNDAFYLFSGGPDWQGSDLCIDSNLITSSLSTASGLRLGQTAAQVRGILGKPSKAADDKVVYSLGVEKKTSAADFENLKRWHPELSDDELHKDYGFYTLGVYIEARFVTGKLVYLGISKTESY